MSKKNFTQLQETWKNFGNIEPHWSVLTQEHYKLHHIKNTENDFYNTGKRDIEIFESILKKHNSTFENKVVLDFGCGVGRLTSSCSEIASKVYGMDISEPHLEIAQKSVPNADFFLVGDYRNLPKIPKKPDIVFSVIVLQHTRPDLIVRYVISLLKTLNTDGIALLHIPYNIIGYIPITSQTNVMEMHFVPKIQIKNIVKKLNCTVLEEIETNYCGSANIKECLYVIKKNKDRV